VNETSENKTIEYDHLISLKERMNNLVIPLPVILKSLIECLKLVQLKQRNSIKTHVNKFIKPGQYVLEKRNLANALSTFSMKKGAK
jgi:hypothetical protein